MVANESLANFKIYERAYHASKFIGKLLMRVSKILKFVRVFDQIYKNEFKEYLIYICKITRENLRAKEALKF